MEIRHACASVNGGQKACKTGGEDGRPLFSCQWQFPCSAGCACSRVPACLPWAGARGSGQTRASGTTTMRQHGEEPPFDGRARVGKLACRRGAQRGAGGRNRQVTQLQDHRRACSARPGNSFHCTEETRCRLFLCARCYRQTLVCSRCDRGQIYCGRECALEVRRRNQRAARARYQVSIRGREMHAERSRRYRVR